MAGSKLTFNMLDLQFNEMNKLYEAPLHIKGLNNTFIIDDFGHQVVTSENLLNRCIVPLQSRFDRLRLHTSKGFQIPFDESVIFSTNLSPTDLMGPASLRRILDKLPIEAPTRADFLRIFEAVSNKVGLEVDDETFNIAVDFLRIHNGFRLACYQPRFVIDQVIDACEYAGVPQLINNL
ncbi:MAG TPA: hypothetical protein QF813_11165 [Alphaproteobacteria bacterium]|jgi:hypothetical protein|nr:hypothetical protein [Alphaproteobacteria bacterium]|tara:strand:+ start:426 stop:962 length:537 start_codon:yes stop_codon:yes gene_type:complete